MTLNPIEVTGAFFFGSLILTFCYLASSKFIKESFKQYWRIIVILILANTAIKIPYKSTFFDGLEYEDSYIYKASARAMYEGKHEISIINPYYPTSCIYGSLRDCKMVGVFVTNFLGYPYVINLGYHLIRYNAHVANIISLLFSGLSIISIFLVAFFIIDRITFALLCSFIYITIPIFNIYASTALTEPLSNAYLGLVLLLYLVFVDLRGQRKTSISNDILGLSAIALTMTFSILIKTTNISLVFCLPIAGFVSLICYKKKGARYQRIRYLKSLSAVLLVLLISGLLLRFQTAIDINRGDIDINPFSFSFFRTLGPIFATSLIAFKWYLFYSALFIVGVIYGIKKKIGIFPIIIFVFYFALYTLHYRSYYFTRGVPVAKDEATRYMISIISPYALVVGLGLFPLWQWFMKVFRKRINVGFLRFIGAVSILLIIYISISFSLMYRAYLVEDEFNVRIAPVLKTLEFIKGENDILITSEHILFQIYGNSDLKLIDFGSIDNQISSQEINQLMVSANVYYLQTMSRGSVDEVRYQKQYRFLDSKTKECLVTEEDYQLYRLLSKQEVLNTKDSL